MRGQLLGALIIAMVMLSPLSPMITEGDTGSRINFGISLRWDSSPVYILLTENNITDTLSITYYGPSIDADLKITASEGINCSINDIDGIHLVNKQPVNFTMNISTKLDDFNHVGNHIYVELINKTYSLQVNTYLEIIVLFPIDTEPHFDEILTTYGTGYGNVNNILCNKYENTISFALTNLLPNFVAEGYLSLRLNYRPKGGDSMIPLIIHSPNLIKLVYNRTQIVNLTIPVIEIDFDEQNQWNNGELTFFQSSDPAESIPLYRIEQVNGTVKSANHDNLNYIFRCGLSIHAQLNPSVAPIDPSMFYSVDFWNGTNLMILVNNLQLKAYKNVRIMVLDIPLTLTLSQIDYWNYSVAWSGDIDPKGEILINVTVYSKISGNHVFEVYLDPDKETKPGYIPRGLMYQINPTNDVFAQLRSGLQITYPDEPYSSIASMNGPEFIYQHEIVSKDALVKYQIQPQAKGLVGATFGISVCLTDQIGFQESTKFYSELDALSNEKRIVIDHQIHGGGWLDQTMFADVNLGSSEFQDNHTYSVSVRPKILGYIDLVPYVKVGDHILLFDKDFKNRTFNTNGDSLCGGGTTKTIQVVQKAGNSTYIVVSSLMPLIISIVLINVFLYKFPTKRKPLRPKKNKKRPR